MRKRGRHSLPVGSPPTKACPSPLVCEEVTSPNNGELPGTPGQRRAVGHKEIDEYYIAG